MTTSKPNRGRVERQVLGALDVSALQEFAEGGFSKSPASRAQRTRSGRWRPNAPFNARDGLKMTMRRIRGVTPSGVLEVPLRFQVPPLNDFTRKWATTWSRYSTLGGGERARAPERPLFEQSISTMLMDGPTLDDHPALAVWTGDPDPQRLLEELRWIMGRDSRRDACVFRLTITQAGLWPGAALVSMDCALTDLQATQKPGEPGTEYVDLTFLEIREETLETRSKKRGKAADRDRSETVRSGEDLHEFAKRMYRAASKWRVIANANGITGVSPDSAPALERWMKKRDKTKLKVPATFLEDLPTAGAGGFPGASKGLG